MTVQALTPARSATRFVIALTAIAGLILALFAAVTPVLADHTGPLVDPDTTTYDFSGDNPDCDDLVTDGLIASFDDEDKFDPGDTSDGEHSSIVNDDEVISFEADDGWLVVAAIIKGGNEGAAVYVYEGLGGVDHDNGLTTPTGQGVSHVTLCLIEAPEESVPPSVEESQEASQEASQTPEGTQFGGTGTPEPSVPDTATGLPSMTGPLATIAFGMILLASLGALAYANVQAVRRRN